VAWPREEFVRFWWRSGFLCGSWIIVKNCLSLADKGINLTFCNVKQMLVNFFAGLGHSLRTNHVDFGGDPIQGPDTGYLNTN